MPAKVVTAPVFHDEMSPLNADASMNISFIELTVDVSH